MTHWWFFEGKLTVIFIKKCHKTLWYKWANYFLAVANYIGSSHHRVRTESWIIEKVLKFAQQYFIAGQNWKKSGKCIYVGENGKKSLENNKTSVLEEILFNSTLMFAVHHDYLCFCILKRSPLIICSITSSLQKINYCQFWKKSGKGLELYGHPKIWMNPAILIMFILYHIPAV